MNEEIEGDGKDRSHLRPSREERIRLANELKEQEKSNEIYFNLPDKVKIDKDIFWHVYNHYKTLNDDFEFDIDASYIFQELKKSITNQ